MIKFKINYLDKINAIQLTVTYGNFTEENSVSTAFSVGEDNGETFHIIEMGLNAVINNKLPEVTEKGIIYNDSFIETFIKTLKNKE